MSRLGERTDALEIMTLLWVQAALAGWERRDVSGWLLQNTGKRVVDCSLEDLQAAADYIQVNPKKTGVATTPG